MILVRPVGRVLALVALLLTLLGAEVGGTTPARADDLELGMCADGGPRPCVISVQRNGAPLDGDWTFLARYFSDGPTEVVRVYALNHGFDLGFESLSDTWQVQLDLGTVVPRAVFGSAQDVVVDRRTSADGYEVTVTGRPVTVSGQCHGDDQVCPEWAADPDRNSNDQWDGTFAITVTEFAGGWDDATTDALYGLNVFSNVASISPTPEIRHDETTGTDYLLIRIANRHFYEDGTTVVHGRAEVRIPNQFLRMAYGVPDPELMSTESLDPEVTGRRAGSGTVEVTQDPDGDAMVVLIDAVTFSHRVLKIKRGVIVPTRPGNFITHRITPTSSELFFTSAEARGAKVRAHEARCAPVRGHQPVVTERGGRAPIIIDDLTPGTRYDCRVRGLSKAGPGPWSTAMRS